MFENFSDRARKVIVLANKHAERLNDPLIGSEHILLALIDVDGGFASVALNATGVDIPALRREIELAVLQARRDAVASVDDSIPTAAFPMLGKELVEHAIEETHAMNRIQVGTEHLLLAVLREPDGRGARALISRGLTLAGVRAKVLEVVRATP